MLYNFIFAALLTNIIVAYLSFNSYKQDQGKMALYFTIISIGTIFVMSALTINLFYSTNPLLVNSPYLLWFPLIFGFGLEIFSLYKKIIPGQLIAASIHLFLVMPTILSIGIVLLLITIVELVIALLYYQKYRQLGI